jgi:peptidoglycan/xylan/chitin deacetylase (PgdA/CDA1 family)
MLPQSRAEQKAHSIMFHHFFDKKHINGQGAISSDQFEKIIDYYSSDLISAEEWAYKARTSSLQNNDICLSFDDALLCQYEIAVPVLKKYDLTAFWFVYSSVLDGEIEMLEIYRKFRTEYFSCIDDFYDAFFSVIDSSQYSNDVTQSLTNYSHDNWKHFPFYSENDTKFRYIRDVSLDPTEYNHIMSMMMKNYQINIEEFCSDLWMNIDHVKDLHSDGHIIGLHSHSHPTAMSTLSAEQQENEYRKNYNFLHDALGDKPTTMSHPCNSYDKKTLRILDDLGIELGFRANMDDHNYSRFEFPREDHAVTIKRIEK